MIRKYTDITNDSLRELAFVITTLVGVLVIALSITFLTIGLSVGTEPPAPYFTSTGQRSLMLALSVFGTGIGLVVMRVGIGFIGR